jgi:hypothetical protein
MILARVSEILEVLLHERGILRWRFLGLKLTDGRAILGLEPTHDLSDSARADPSQQLTFLVGSIRRRSLR